MRLLGSWRHLCVAMLNNEEVLITALLAQTSYLKVKRGGVCASVDGMAPYFLMRKCPNGAHTLQAAFLGIRYRKSLNCKMCYHFRAIPFVCPD